MIALRLRWTGDAPDPGDYLKTSKGRTAYRVIEITRIRSRTPVLGSRMLRFRCERSPAAQLPPDARVHPMWWNSRAPRPTKARTMRNSPIFPPARGVSPVALGGAA